MLKLDQETCFRYRFVQFLMPRNIFWCCVNICRLGFVKYYFIKNSNFVIIWLKLPVLKVKYCIFLYFYHFWRDKLLVKYILKGKEDTLFLYPTFNVSQFQFLVFGKIKQKRCVDFQEYISIDGWFWSYNICVSRKQWPILYYNLLFKIGHFTWACSILEYMFIINLIIHMKSLIS